MICSITRLSQNCEFLDLQSERGSKNAYALLQNRFPELHCDAYMVVRDNVICERRLAFTMQVE